MLDGFSMHITCAVEQCSLTQCFTCLKEILNHPGLSDEEKCLWLWLFANRSANNMPFLYSLSYEQISHAVNKSSEKIHRLLTRLRVMGALFGNFPVHYGKLTTEMIQAVYNLRLGLPPKLPINAILGETAKS